MQAKKNPKLDLRKYSALFFVFGLALTLFIESQMTPEKQHGRAFRVPFSIPIVFRLQN